VAFDGLRSAEWSIAFTTSFSLAETSRPMPLAWDVVGALRYRLWFTWAVIRKESRFPDMERSMTTKATGNRVVAGTLVEDAPAEDPPADLGPGDPEGAITRLLIDAQAGEEAAWNRIYALVYADLHRIARGQIRKRAFGRMSATSLVSESWLRLSGAHFGVENRRHFTSLVARAMRFVLMDEVRRDLAEKRGDGQSVFSLDEDIDRCCDDTLEDMVALDAALTRLSGIDERLARLVEMRYFGGLDENEIADALGVTDRTIRRDWRKARAFLMVQLGGGRSGPLVDGSIRSEADREAAYR
jgi:RNA polymerase sigma factor (TIGR02999 family)